MDEEKFDDLARDLVIPRHRRSVLASIGGGALAVVAGAFGLRALAPEEVSAKKKRKKKGKKGKDSCVFNPASCSSDSDCCDNNCGIGKDGSSICCGGFDEYCASDAECCGDLRCSAGSACL